MGRAKGTPKTGGRKAGTPNKVTGTAKEWIAGLIDNNRTQIENDMKKLDPKERLQMLEKLMQYVIPKQQAVSAKIDFAALPDDVLDNLVDELTKDIQE